MRYYLLAITLILSLSIGASSCNKESNSDPFEQPPTTQTPEPEKEDTSKPTDENNKDNNNTMSNDLEIIIGNSTFNAQLEDNATAKAFKKLLPLTIKMSEFGGNEKYYNLSESLPTNSSQPGTINEGDLMLYGSDCLVLFYKTFSSSYSYTRIGKINNPKDIANAVGSENISITFKLK